MIYGIGSDLLAIKRIEWAFERHPIRFAEKLLSETEKKQFAKTTRPVNFLAKRWAAKEAFAKACGTGIRAPVLFPAISLVNDAFGKPSLTVSPILAEWLNARKINKQHLTLSDEEGMVIAFVILESAQENPE